jgi:hypothetical protein
MFTDIKIKLYGENIGTKFLKIKFIYEFVLQKEIIKGMIF